MLNIVKSSVQGIRVLAKCKSLMAIGAIAFLGLLFGPLDSQAAIGTTTQNWPATPIYSAAAYPSAAITYNAVAGNNRLLVVGISASTTAVNQPQPTVTYGGVSMTPAVGVDATATQQHSYLFYLPLGTSAIADTGKSIVVTISGGTARYCSVNAAVYTGVDQATPVAVPVRSSNNTTAGTAVGPFTLAVASGDLGVSVLNAVAAGTTKASAATITIGTTGHLWNQVSTSASTRIVGAIRTTYATTGNVNTVSATQHTSSASTLNSTAAMAIKPMIGVSLTNGSSVAGNKNVYVGDANATNVVIDAFTMSAAAPTTVTSITVTSNAYTTSDKVSAIKIWRKVGATLTAWEATDVLVASGTPNGGAQTLATNEPVSALANYIVTYDVAATAAASTSSFVTGTVTAITPAPLDLTDTTALSASLYIYPTTTVGNGTEPVATRLGKGSAATNMDAFTLAHNGATSAEDETVTSVTVTMAPQYISGGSGSTVSKIRLVEIVNAAGTVVYGSATAATTGDVWNIPTTLASLIVTSTPTTYYVRVSTANVINPSVDDPSGTVTGYYTFSGTITDLIHSKAANKLVAGDSASQTLIIDVEKPAGPATATATTGGAAGTISLVWDAATDAHGGALDGTKPYVIMRSAPDGTQPAPNCTEGTDISTVIGVTVDYASRTAVDAGLVDTTPTRYYYRICAKDGQGNLSDGAATYANAKVNNICNTTPTVSLTGEDGLSTSQVVKSANSAPFKLMVSNNDIGVCPDSDFNLALVNEVNPVNFDKAVGATQPTAVPFPTTVKLGTGGAGAPTGKTLNVYITGKPTANQLEVYKFGVQVSEAGHGTPAPTAQMTAMLNDMPPIVHNSSNMGKFQYGNWGQTYTCATCHSNSTTNIKGIYQLISTPIGRRNVVFTKTSSVDTDYTGVFSNDKRTVNTISNSVCSVCHHQTRQHQYSASKALLNNGSLGVVGPNGDEAYNADHHNARDCVRCHTHNTAFRSIYGQCGDCHGFKATGYSPVSKNTMVKDLTNALGPNPPNYGAHQRHNIAKMTCATCHSNTNHGLLTTAWQGDNLLEMGFSINKDTYPGFNPGASIVGGTFYGTSNLNAPFVWSAGPGTTITPIADYNASCNTYCHGQWTGNSGSNTTPIWVGSSQAACGGCHNATGSQPPASGSHVKHAGNTGTGLGIACIKCHGTYANYTGNAHINGNVEWDMTVAFPGGTYSSRTNGSTNAPAPTTGGFGTCSNLYCHSNVQGADGTGSPTAHSTPTWGGTAPCGSCHVVPNTTGSHASHENAEVAFDCHACHNNGGTTTALNHANGTINFEFVGLAQNTVYSLGNAVTPGTPYGTCSNSNCHGRFTRAWGSPASGLPQCEKCHGSRTSNGFYSTRGPSGTLSIYSAGIGVHDIHLQNLNSPRKATFARFTSYAVGYNCNQCHRVPSGPFSNGHIDTPLPAEVPFTHMSSIAATGQVKFSYYTTPTYNAATQTCSAIWCHGAGMNSNNSTGPYAGVAPAVQRQNPAWNVPFLTGNGNNDCSKCHAVPPPAPDASYIHFGKTLANCKECHTHVGNDGLSFKNKSLHANGAIDGGCDKCHGYPPINNIIGDREGLATPAQGALQQGTAGAHNAHVLNGNIGKNCQTCHYNFSAAMPSNNLELGFNAFNGAVVSGTFTGYSNSGTHPRWLSTSAGTVIQKTNVAANANVCSNLYCHGGGTATLPALGGGSKTTPNWEGGSSDAICGSCHGTDTTSAPTGGSHSRHALATNGGSGLLCVTCHKSTVDMSHVNGSVSWYLDHDNPAVGANATYNNTSSGTIVGLAPRSNGTDYRNCNNVYCHSNVQGNTGTGSPTTYGSPKWGANGTLNCGSCHQNMATDGTATGSHVKHANTSSGMGVACGYCHQDGGSGTVLHADGAIFVNFTSYVGGLYSNGTPLNAGMNKNAGSVSYGSCSATFCHGTAASPAWGTPGPLACNTCHGAKVDSPTWSGRHNTHYNYSTMPTSYTQTVTDLSNTSKYRFNCAHCHDDNVTRHSLKPQSANSAARVFFGISSATPAASSKRGTYSYGASANSKTDNGFKFTAGSCNTSYCHSNGAGGAPKVSFLNWTTRPTAGSNCTFCHDSKSITATATTLSGKHDKHMNPANNALMGLGNGFNCVDCHARTITNTNNVVVANKAKHVNAYLDYSGARANKTYNGTTKQCSNVYCHSNGNPNAIVFVTMTGSKVWNGAKTITTCNNCHGRGNSLGYPDYANGGANTATSNLHAGHLAGMTDTLACADCHRKTADTLVVNKFRPYSTTHLSGGPNVNFNTAKTYVGTKATVATAGFQVTCSQIVCHGQGAPVWGTSTTANQCQKCHGDRGTAFGTFSSPQVAPGYNGTGTDTSMTKSAPTDPRVGAHQRHLVTNVISAPVKCGECHVTVTGIRAANHWNYSTATLTFTGRATLNSHTPSVSRTSGIMQCSNVNCHNGKYNSGTTPAPFWNMTGMVKETGTTVGDCTKCHAMPPSGYANHPAALSNSAAISTIYASCGTCHNTLSSSATTVGNVFTSKASHINGSIEVSMPCNGCHSYLATDSWTTTYGVEGIGAHIKHINYLTARYGITLNPSTDVFGSGNSAAVCGVCHTINPSDHSMDQSVNVRTINFGGSTAHQYGSGAPTFNGITGTSSSVNPKTCSNIDCHYLTSPIWSTY